MDGKDLYALMEEGFFTDAPFVEIDKKTPVIPDPKEIKAYLDRFVVGQDVAKKAVSTLLTNHLYRYDYNAQQTKETGMLTKSNMLLIGDSGVGKSYVVKVAAEFVDIPIVVEDATKLTQEGYVGDSVDTILTRLFLLAGRDTEKTEKGIVFLDEFDKLGRDNSRHSVSTTAVQQSLLKMVEGSKLSIPTQLGDRSASRVEIDTTNITFIFAGAFGGMASKIKEKRALGFVQRGAETEICEGDILKYGIIPEILGRIGTYITLDPLTSDDLMSILTKVDNSLISRYQKLFEIRGLKWPLKAKDYKKLIATVKDTKLGARGLLRHLEKVLLPHMYGE